MQRCFVYSKIAFGNGCEILSVGGSVPLNSGIFKFVLALNTKLFKSVAFPSSSLVILSTTTRNMLLLDLLLSDNRSLIVSQNCFLSAMFFSFKLAKYSFLSFVKEIRSNCVTYCKQFCSLQICFSNMKFSNELFSIELSFLGQSCQGHPHKCLQIFRDHWQMCYCFHLHFRQQQMFSKCIIGKSRKISINLYLWFSVTKSE